MKGFILAAGLGTRLKPWTDSHPKALVPVAGVPMLERVIDKMHRAGITDITVNVHHFADQIIDFILSKGWRINISDERERLLDTGGALLHAAEFLEGTEPVLVHNADILSDADLNDIIYPGADVSLLVSDRTSSRKLIFDAEMNLEGWHNLTTGEFRPDYLYPSPNPILPESSTQLAFSGIYVFMPRFLWEMRQQGWDGCRFSIVDYWLDTLSEGIYKGVERNNLRLIDIGKPDSLNRAKESGIF